MNFCNSVLFDAWSLWGNICDIQWDITPDPHVLGRLPQGYNLEYALADEVVKFLTMLGEFSSFILLQGSKAKSKVEDFFGAFILWLSIPYVQDNALQAVWNVADRRRLIRLTAHIEH